MLTPWRWHCSTFQLISNKDDLRIGNACSYADELIMSLSIPTFNSHSTLDVHSNTSCLYATIIWGQKEEEYPFHLYIIAEGLFHQYSKQQDSISEHCRNEREYSELAVRPTFIIQLCVNGNKSKIGQVYESLLNAFVSKQSYLKAEGLFHQ